MESALACGPGSDYTDLSIALDAALDGDILLVRPGLYFAWNDVDGRSLTIAGDGPFVQIAGQITVRNLAANQAFGLRRITFQYPGELSAINCVGPVLVEDCTIRADLSGGSGTFGAIYAQNARVVVTDSIIIGSAQYAAAGAPPTSGIYALNSALIVSGSTVLGGDGIDTYGDDVPGAPGMVLQGSTATVQGSSSWGGSGQTQPGGAGLNASSASSVVLRNGQFGGGSGVPGGESTVLDTGSLLTQLGGLSVDLDAPSPVREQESWTMTVSGAPGDSAWVLLGFTPAWLPLSPTKGVLTLSAPLVFLPLGTLDASGMATLATVIPELGFDAVPLQLQAAAVPAGGGGAFVLGERSLVTLLDSAF